MNLQRIINWTLNTIAIGSVVIVGTVLAQRHFQFRGSSSSGVAPIREGSSFHLNDVQWAQNSANLVMVLSTQCHYCRESEGFYRTLIQSAPKTLHTIAVFLEPVVESTKYLQEQGIAVSEIRQANLTDLGVSGTPTLILADSTGRARSIWTGKLSPEQEKVVYAKLGIKFSGQDRRVQPPSSQALSRTAERAATPEIVTPAELKRLLTNENNSPVVDIRDRDEFSKGHIADSVNIPLDELESRAVHELPVADTIFLYCYSGSMCHKPSSASRLSGTCSDGTLILHDAGFAHVKQIDSDLQPNGLPGIQKN